MWDLCLSTFASLSAVKEGGREKAAAWRAASVQRHRKAGGHFQLCGVQRFVQVSTEHFNLGPGVAQRFSFLGFWPRIDISTGEPVRAPGQEQ